MVKEHELQDALYELYKEQWLQEQIKLGALPASIREDKMAEYQIMRLQGGTYAQTLEDYLWDTDGYNGSLYVCKDEFLGAEYQDAEYVHGLMEKMQKACDPSDHIMSDYISEIRQAYDTNFTNDVREMHWRDYCEKFGTDALYFSNDDESIFFLVSEGTGDNLLDEDIEEGCVDYWNVEGINQDGEEVGGGFLMLKKTIYEENPTISEILDYLKENASVLDGSEEFLECQLVENDYGEELRDRFEEYAAERFERIRKETLEQLKMEER